MDFYQSFRVVHYVVTLDYVAYASDPKVESWMLTIT